MRLTIQVGVSCLLVVGVLWFMWRLPRRDGSWFVLAPLLSLASIWVGVFALLGSVLLWWAPQPDLLLTVLLLLLDPISVSAGILVLWIYRGGPVVDHAIDHVSVDRQRLQARVGLAIGVLAVALGYVYALTHTVPLAPAGT